MTDEKLQKIKHTLEETRERRMNMRCKTYKVKITSNKLNEQQKEWLKKIFVEAKWFYNHIISQQNIFEIKQPYSIKEVDIKTKSGMEQRNLTCLCAKSKQMLHERICTAITLLSHLKTSHFKVGKLKFKKEISSIEFPQLNNNWKIQGSSVKLTGCKKKFKVAGLNQIPKDADLANALLIRKPSGYYIHITAFVNKNKIVDNNKSIGLDFGIKNNITTSDGQVFNFLYPETERLKRLQGHLSSKKPKSNNRYKLIKKIRLEYEKITNRKNAAADKFVHFLKTNYNEIYIQDESLAEWQKSLFGAQVQHSILGAIKARLINLESVRVIDKFAPTTKQCYVCGFKNDIELKDRIFKCSNCGHEEDRDIKAAKTILEFGKNSRVARTKTPGRPSRQRFDLLKS